MQADPRETRAQQRATPTLIRPDLQPLILCKFLRVNTLRHLFSPVLPWHPVKNQTPVGEQQSLEACELLAGTSPGNAARVINEELKEVSDQEVQAGPEVVLVCPGYIMA